MIYKYHRIVVNIIHGINTVALFPLYNTDIVELDYKAKLIDRMFFTLILSLVINQHKWYEQVRTVLIY